MCCCWEQSWTAVKIVRNSALLPLLLSYYNGSLEKRGPSLVLSTCCFANFKPLKLLQCIICLSALLPSDWAVALEVSYLFSELFETSQSAQGLSDFIKRKAVNACIACFDLLQQLCLFESVNLYVQIYLAQRGRATVLLTKVVRRGQI